VAIDFIARRRPSTTLSHMAFHGTLSAQVFEAPLTHPQLAITGVVLGREGCTVPRDKSIGDTQVKTLDLGTTFGLC
jgi:hypothetical protein